MAVNPNFTNANAATSFFTSSGGGGGGGGSNFPSGITIGSNNPIYTIQPDFYWGANPALSLLSVSTPQIWKAASFLSYQGSPPEKSGQYLTDGIIYQGNAGSGSGSALVSVNDGALGGTNAFNLLNISTIQGPNILVESSNVAFTAANGLVRILPNQNAINAQNLVFTSTINALNSAGTGLAGAINMTDLTSTIIGYNFARVGAAVP